MGILLIITILTGIVICILPYNSAFVIPIAVLALIICVAFAYYIINSNIRK